MLMFPLIALSSPDLALLTFNTVNILFTYVFHTWTKGNFLCLQYSLKKIWQFILHESQYFTFQTLALIQENESLKHRLRQADGLELERDELTRQLEMAKEDLFNEQKQARHKVEELKDVRQHSIVNLTVISSSWLALIFIRIE